MLLLYKMIGLAFGVQNAETDPSYGRILRCRCGTAVEIIMFSHGNRTERFAII